MGLTYNALDDDGSDLDAYDLSQSMLPSSQAGVSTDPKKLKEAPGFFSGSSTAIQRGVKAGIGKIAVSLIGTEEENLEALKDNKLQQQLYEEAKRVGSIDPSVTLEQYTSNSYKESKKDTMKFVKDNSPNEGDGLASQVLNSLGDYGARGVVGGNSLGAAYVVGTSTKDYIYNKLIGSGVDEATAQKASINDGIADAISMAVPVYRGKGIIKNSSLVAAPVALTEAGHAVNNSMLEDKGYKAQAKEYEFSTEGVLTGLVLGGAINRGSAYLDARNTRLAEQTMEQAQDTAQLKDDVVPSIVNRIDEEYNELGLHSDDIQTREKTKQNRNAVENQIMNKQPINVPHADVQEPPAKPQKITAERAASYTSKPWAKKIAFEAEKRGISPVNALVISHLETGGTFDPNIQPPINKKTGKRQSTATGVFQALDGTRQRMGGGDKFDGNAQINVGLNYYKYNSDIFKKKFNRDPTGLEVYFMHFFGEGGGPSFLKAADSDLFVDAATRWHKDTKKKTARQQASDITNGHGFQNMTVGQVKAKYQKRWNEIEKKYGGDGSNVSTAYGMDGSSYDVSYEVKSLDDLIASNDAAFGVNPNYPSELQPRDRTREASHQQIEDMANNLRPELLGESYKLSDGAPIIGMDNVVESGNGRTMAIGKAYESGKADAYRQYVNDFATSRGMDISGINNPVLVRTRLTDTDRVQFSRLANESDVAQFSSSERAKSDVDRLPDTSTLKINNDGSLNLDGSMDFVRGFVDQLPKSERASAITADGRLSQDGKRRIESALVQRAYNDSSLVTRLSENLDDDSKTVLNALLKAAPQLSQLSDLVKQGGRHSNTIAADLAQAAQKLSDLKATGLKVNDYLNQGQLIDDGLSPGARDFLNTFDQNNRSAKAIGDDIQAKINEIESMGDPRQGSLFGGTPEQDLALKIMQDNPDMPVSALFEDASGNQIEVNSVANLVEKIEQDFALAKQDEVATKAAISCALQFG